ncbi:MAG: hypothetical protein RIS47_1159 [Bacteroidota bacterium]|jgi:cysteine desulfuration protein SufE
MTINEVQDQIIEEFAIFDEWMDKYEYIIEIGKDVPPISEAYKTSQNLIKGCQSQVWLNAELIGPKIEFTADSDAIITKGIVGLLIRVLNQRSPQEILDTELYFIEQIGLSSHLSPTRANGLVSMVKEMKLYAMAYQAKLGL